MNKPQLVFSHIGLYVDDMEKMVDFYTNVMGFFVTDRGMLNGETPITFMSRDPLEHHQLVFVQGRDTLPNTRLLNQLSFRIGTLSELLEFVRGVAAKEISDLEPVIHGNAWSLYFRDPEGNRAEVFADSDWYINQPIKESFDFALSEEEIRRQTYEFCKDQPGFRPLSEWQNDMKIMMTTSQMP